MARGPGCRRRTEQAHLCSTKCQVFDPTTFQQSRASTTPVQLMPLQAHESCFPKLSARQSRAKRSDSNIFIPRTSPNHSRIVAGRCNPLVSLTCESIMYLKRLYSAETLAGWRWNARKSSTHRISRRRRLGDARTFMGEHQLSTLWSQEIQIRDDDCAKCYLRKLYSDTGQEGMR